MQTRKVNKMKVTKQRLSKALTDFYCKVCKANLRLSQETHEFRANGEFAVHCNCKAVYDIIHLDRKFMIRGVCSELKMQLKPNDVVVHVDWHCNAVNCSVYCIGDDNDIACDSCNDFDIVFNNGVGHYRHGLGLNQSCPVHSMKFEKSICDYVAITKALSAISIDDLFDNAVSTIFEVVARRKKK